MNLAANPSQSLRKAALAVHALAAPDRAWVLHALPRDHREELEPLLAELKALGIPADPSVYRETDAAPREPELAWPDTLDAATLAALSHTLAGEPEQLTHALLAVQSWSWGPRLLAGLTVERRAALAEAPARGPVTPRLASVLLQVLHETVTAAQDERHEPVAAAPRAWQRLRAVLAPLRRRA
jgi:hypothetical protein